MNKLPQSRLFHRNTYTFSEKSAKSPKIIYFSVKIAIFLLFVQNWQRACLSCRMNKLPQSRLFHRNTY